MARNTSTRRMTTARKGKTASSATKARSHVARSSGAGRANASAPADKGGGTQPSARRWKRGPGSAGKEAGRSQSASGAGPRGQAPKRAK